MISRDELINEFAKVINRNSLEHAFNDTPDFVLAKIAVEAIENFATAFAHRDDYHNFRTAEYEKKRNAILNRKQNEKPDFFKAEYPNAEFVTDDVLRINNISDETETEAMKEFLEMMYPGTRVEVYEIKRQHRKPRSKRRAKQTKKRRL